MRAILSTSLLAVLVAVGISACSGSSTTASSAGDQTAASSAAADNSATTSDNSAASDNTAASAAPAESAAAAPAGGESGAPPVYPGATAGTAPAGVGLKQLPKSVKVYYTSDDFGKVKTWYVAQLKGAQEMQQPGKEKTMDAFLVGQGPSGKVVMIQSLDGKVWIVIGPPM